MSLLKETILGFWSLVTGLRLTIREFFRPTITVHYPHQTLPMPARFRGHIELKWNAETGRANCTACNLCAKACPSACIELEGVRPAGEKGKAVTRYRLDYTLCSLCSLCVEACPFDAIQHSNRYNLASVPNTWADMDLFERYKQQVLRAAKTPFIPVAAPPAPPAAKPEPSVAAPTANSQPPTASAPNPKPAPPAAAAPNPKPETPNAKPAAAAAPAQP